MTNVYKKIFFLFVMIAFLPGCTALKAIKLVNSGEIVHGNNTKSVIPFEINGHPIFIKGRLNNSEEEYTFIFDTGALTVISQQVAKELKVQNEVEVEVRGSGGNTETVNLVQLNSILVGNSEVKNCAAAVVDFSGKFGSDMGGILGSNFFKFFQVSIDYQKKELILLQGAQPLLKTEDEIRIPFETDMKYGLAPKIECVIDGEINGTGLIDTGFPGIISLPISMMKKTESFQEGKVLAAKGSMTGGMFGMEEESYLLRVNTLEVGSLKLANIPSMSHSLDDEHILFGNTFLSKFKVTLDYPAKEMVLQPHEMSFETNIPSYGLTLARKDKKTIVSGIWDNSSASRSGIKLGNEVVEINSHDARAFSVFELVALFTDDKSKEMEIVFIDDKQEHTIILHKEMLLPEL